MALWWISSRMYTWNDPPRKCAKFNMETSPKIDQGSSSKTVSPFGGVRRRPKMSLLQTAFPEIRDLMEEDPLPAPNTPENEATATEEDEEGRGPRQRGPPIERKVVAGKATPARQPQREQGSENRHRAKTCYHCQQKGHIQRGCPLLVVHNVVRPSTKVQPVRPTPRLVAPVVPKLIPLGPVGPVVARPTPWQPPRHAPYPPTNQGTGVWRQPTNTNWALQQGGTKGEWVSGPVQNFGSQPLAARPTQLQQVAEVLRLMVQLGQH